MRPLLAGPWRSRLSGLILLAFTAGCAYYNTFFLARKYYNEGAKAQEKSTTDRPSPDAIAKFDQTIRQCDKLIVEYPKSKYVDDASYYRAASFYGKGDYDGAIRKLGEFQVNYPNSSYIPDARFTEGLARYKRKDYEQADSIFAACDTLYPKFPRRWDLYYSAGQCRFQLKDYPMAAWWYGRALEVAKDRHQKSDALRRDGDAFLASDRPDTAVALYTQCLKVEERGVQRLDVAFSLAGALQDQGKNQEALTFLEEWKVFAANANRQGELYLRIYECMAALGRVQEAIQGYQKLVAQYPSTPVAFEAQFQIGYLYESQLQDYDAASREYEKLRGQQSSQFGAQAARRAQNLATLKRFRQAMASDTTNARSRAAFQLAEFYYFQMDKADSAVIQYRMVEYQFPRSVYAPKSAYARLWITAHDRNDTLAAMLLTDSIANNYRGTRYAESALYFWRQWSWRTDARTALLDSLLANPDTSRMAEFEPEPQAPKDTLAVPQVAGYTLTHADSVRIDSLRLVAQAYKEKLRESRGGPPPSKVPSHPQGTVGPMPPGPVPPPGGGAAVGAAGAATVAGGSSDPSGGSTRPYGPVAPDTTATAHPDSTARPDSSATNNPPPNQAPPDTLQPPVRGPAR